MMKKLVLLVSVALLSACKMQQDPIAGAPEAVREGRPPSAQKPVQEKPLDKNALQIDAPSLVNGRIGIPVEINISGRIMTTGINFQLSIDNLADFPGATFDASSGEFRWTPTKSLMGGFPSIELPLRVTMVTVPTKENPSISVERKTLSLVILNSYSKPIINSVNGPASVSTGTQHTFPFSIEDTDALGARDVSVDVRDCSTGYYTTSIAHLASVRKVEEDKTAPNKYKGEVILNLSSADNLLSGAYCFGLMAVSKHGVASEIYSKDFSVEAKMKATRMTMSRTLELVVGDRTQLSFSIYDPSGAGALSVVSMDDVAQLLPGSGLSCSLNRSSKAQLDCFGLIDARSAQAKIYILNLSIENAGTHPSQRTLTNHTLRILVKAATP